MSRSTQPRPVRNRIALAAGVALAAASAGSLVGCSLGPYRTGGSQYSNDQYTYISQAHSPKTVELVDTRTGEVVWSVDVPVGQQLTFRFYENREPDNIYTPAMMRWDIYRAKQFFGRKANALLVPPAEARRIDVHVRPGPEYAPMPPAANAG